MKKVLLCFPVSLNNLSNGVTKKCLGIIDAFKQRYNVDVFTENEGILFFNEEMLKNYSNNKTSFRYYSYTKAFLLADFKILKKKCKEKEYDIIYLRLHWFLSIGFILFLRQVKKNNPAIIINIEIPTYPYKEEIMGRFNKARFLLTKLLTPLLKPYVNNIITFSQHKKIWGIPAINLSNGYYNPELKTIQNSIILQNTDRDAKNFHIVMIAQFSPWHAPDILIESVNRYFLENPNPRNIIVHLIGTGVDLEACKGLVENYKLQKNILFYGELDTEAIVKTVTAADICVGSLGHHRTDIQLSSSLKTREYAFLGMPIILKTADLDFPDSLFFVKYFPDDDSLLDLNSIIYFLEMLKVQYPDYKNKIMDYANENLTWRKKMNKVFETY